MLQDIAASRTQIAKALSMESSMSQTEHKVIMAAFASAVTISMIVLVRLIMNM